MKRWFSVLLSGISLVACIAMAWIWARSHDAPEAIFSASGGWQLVSCDGRITWYESPRPGRLRYLHRHAIWYEPDTEAMLWPRMMILDALREHGRFGFVWLGGWRPRVLVVPHASLVVLFAIAPAAAVTVSLRRRFRPAAGRETCSQCGYDLCATPERCPECGTAVEVRR
jgi:hypothetical protein